MRQSSKEVVLLQAENRLLHNDVQQSLGMQAASFTMESAQEWMTGAHSIRQSPRRPIR
ncbi:MAG: hypothetical protein K0R67_1030 [Paenibacillus sp.]|jgi:hypothetical protein|nr:hypothetical protein [Paenibacillus sp.]